MWFIGDEVGQETSAPPPKKILEPPLGQQVYLSILFENCLEKWGVHYIFRCTLYKRKYGIPTHNIQKLFSNTLWKKGNCAEINCLLLFSIILKVFLLLDFIFIFLFFLSVKPVEEKKLLPFLMTVMKTAESFQATYVATSVPKTVSLLKENQ